MQETEGGNPHFAEKGGRSFRGEEERSENEWGSGANPLKSRKGFGYDVRKAKRRPSNATTRDETFTEAVLDNGIS